MPPPPPIVVPRHCVAMTVALEIVAEHRRKRARADVDEAKTPPKKRAGTRER